MQERKPNIARTERAANERAEELRALWGALVAGGRTGRIPPAMLRRIAPDARDRRVIRDTLRAVAASAPIAFRGAIADAGPGSPEWFDRLTVAADLARNKTQRRALEYARAHCARALRFTK